MDQGSAVRFRIYFSDFFGVPPEAIEEYGAFDVSLINDLPLFIDPFLLFNSEKPEYQELHRDIVRYVQFLRDISEHGLSGPLIGNWFRFPEIRQNWLGYSAIGNAGRGLGEDFANALRRNLQGALADFGKETISHGSHLEKLCLIKSGVGRDTISDFTTNLIHGFLAGYTERFARDHISKARLGTFHIRRAAFNFSTRTWQSKSYVLPRFQSDYVLLTPVDILTKDEAWINQNDLVEDFSRIVASLPNDELRAQLDRYLIEALPFDATKEERREGVLKAAERYPEVIDYYILDKENRAEEATTQSAEKVRETYELFHVQLRSLADALQKNTNFYEEGGDSYEEAHRRLSYLKHVIENKDGYRVFFVKGRRINREKDLQIMFKLVWFATTFDVNSEVDNGRGPADFAISKGSRDKTYVEFKLASNRKLKQNLKKQAEIYSRAGDATHPPIKAILYFSDSEQASVTRILRELGLEGHRDIVLIDARRKSSASVTS